MFSAYAEWYNLSSGGAVTLIHDPYYAEPVGIGTVNPQGLIHTERYLPDYVDGTTHTSCPSGYTQGNLDNQADNDDCRAIGLVAKENGNVGIGTTNPLYKLAIEGSGNMATSNVTTSGDTAISGYRFAGAGGTNADWTWGTNASNLGGLNSNAFLINNGNSVVPLVIQANGNVGIGTTTPNAKLQVNGEIFSTGAAGNVHINYADGNNYFRGNNMFGNDTGVWLANGNVGIGTTSPSGKLDVEGGAAFLPAPNAAPADASFANGQYSIWQNEATDKFQIKGKDSTGAVITQTVGDGTATWGNINGTLSAQTDLNTALGSKLNLAGGTLTGALTLAGAPTVDLHASTKKYVDDLHALDLDKSVTNEIQNLSSVLTQGNDAGGTKLTNLGAPTVASDAATKGYADTTFLKLSGGTMTGNLVLNADPSAALGATTKQYVDNLVNGLTWKAPVTDADGPTGGLGSYGTCDAGKQSWASYNKSDNIIYVCNGSAWVQMSSTVGIPSLAGEVTGPLTSNVVADNTIDSANIINGTIADTDVSATAAIAGTKISPNFGSQNVVTTGNLGVGTASPGGKLSVLGVGQFMSNASPTGGAGVEVGYDGTEGYVQAYDRNTSTGKPLWLNYGIGNTILGGNVGIGTTNPGKMLEVNAGTSGHALRLTNSNTNSGIEMVTSAGTYSWLVGANNFVSNAFEIAPSTTVGGTTFTTPILTALQNGKVGIGTASPDAKLTVGATTDTTSQMTLQGEYQEAGFTNNNIFNFRHGGYNRMRLVTSQKSVASNNFDFGIQTINDTVNGYNEWLTIKGLTGNVGIGTTSPSRKLEVAGSAKITGNLDMDSGTISNLLNPTANQDAATKAYVDSNIGSISTSSIKDTDNDTKVQVEESADEDKIRFDTAGSERMIIDASGNVGVGTTNPLARLHLHQTATSTMYLTDDTVDQSYGGAIRGYGVSGYGGFLSLGALDAGVYNQGINVTQQANEVKFFTNTGSNGSTAERMRINASGNVGIGTTTPSQKLEVAGNAKIAGNIQVPNNQLVTGTGFKETISSTSGEQEVGRYYDVATLRLHELAGFVEIKLTIEAGAVGQSYDYVFAPSYQFVEYGGSSVWHSLVPVRKFERSGNIQDDWGVAIKWAGDHNFDVRVIKTEQGGTYATQQRDIHVTINDPTGGLYAVTDTSGTGTMTIPTDLIYGGPIYIVNSGNVGIGTNSPSGKLDVEGGAAFLPAPNSAPADASFANGQYSIWQNETTDKFQIKGKDSTGAVITQTVGDGSATWGNINGTLSAQTDLNTALGTKLNLAGGTMTGNLNLGANTLTTSNTGLVSNLNADLLDGQHGSYYMPAATDNWVNTNGDTMTGNLVLNADPSAALGAATKQYVDNLVNGLTWKAPVTDADGPTGGLGSYGTCDAGKQSWASYNKSDNIIYVCNGSAWVQMSSTVGLPNLAGEVTGSITSNVVADNVIDNANIKSNAAIAGTKISPNFGSQNVVTTGNVGVGTASPSTKLQVGAEIIDDNNYSYDSNTTYLVHQTPTSASAINDPKTVLLLGRQGTGGQAYGAGAAFNLSRYENNGVNSRSRLDISLANNSFDVNSNNVMTLLSSGNVGIGTTNPQYKLEVLNTGGSTSQPNTALVLDYESNTTALAGAGTALLLRGKSSGGNIANYDQARIRSVAYDSNNTHGLAFDYKPNGATPLTEGMRISGSGNVGIGTANPTANLEVIGNVHIGNQNAFDNPGGWNKNVLIDSTAHGRFRIKASNHTYGAVDTYLWADSSVTPSSGIASSHAFSISANGNNISFPSGNVGIGTTNPGAKLELTGSFKHNARIEHPVGTLGEGTTQAKRFEIARIGFDANNWSSNTDVFVELYQKYWEAGGYKKYAVRAGYTDDGSVRLLDASGLNSTMKEVKVTIGSPVLVSGSIYYLPVYVNTDYYSRWDVVVSHGMTEVASISASGQVVVYENPSGSDISSFEETDIITHDFTNYFSGNVGIGTTAPGAKLDVSHTTSGVPLARFTQNAGWDGSNYTVRANGYSLFGDIRLAETGVRSIYNIASGGQLDIATNNGIITFTNGGAGTTERMRIATDGNVGIGTTNPGYKLDVNGAVNAASGFYWNGQSLDARYAASGSTSRQYQHNVTVTAGYTKPLSRIRSAPEGSISVLIQVQSKTGGHSGTKSYLFQGGYAALGSSFPGSWHKMQPLEVGRGHGDSTAGFDLYIRAGSDGYDYDFGVASVTNTKNLIVTINDLTGGDSTRTDISSGGEVATSSAGDVYSHRSMNIEGNVGIGTTSPNQQLEITKAFRMPNTTDATTGVVYKGTDRFMHNYKDATADGYNTFVGLNAGNFTMGPGGGASYLGSYNTAVGQNALSSNTTGYYNTANGVNALVSNTTGYQNTAIGLQALYNNTTGSYNSALGMNALVYNTTGSSNTASGMNALYNNTTGSDNTANGLNALFNNTTGYSNTASGRQALYSNTTGYNNTASGRDALYYNTTGADNTANGWDALHYNTTGYQNTGDGNRSGFNPANDIAQYRITTDTNMTLLGYGATKNNAAQLDNGIAIGSGAHVLASNQAVLGNDSITTTLLKGNVGIGTTNPGAKLDVNGYVRSKTGYLDRNMLNPTVWTPGTGSAGEFYCNGSTAECERVWQTDPLGKPALVWSGTNDVGSDADGGWGYPNIPIDNNKAYRVSVWFKKDNTTSGNFYLGSDGGNTNNLDNTNNTNPYFHAFNYNGNIVADRWYLAVGYIHANNDPSTTSYSAVYDGVTGKKVLTGTDYKNRGALSVQTHRTYNYYDTTAGSKPYFWGPRFEEIDGNEPSIESMLGVTQGATKDVSSYFGGNVGIGTTSPGAPLAFGKSVYGATDNENFYRMKLEDVGGTMNDTGIGQPTSGSIGFNVVAGSGYYSFNLGTNGEALRIAATGNVGIGTNSPSGKLDVEGGAAFLPAPNAAPADASFANGQYSIWQNETTDKFQIKGKDSTGAVITQIVGDGTATWGNITGTLSAQTDLNTALGTKLNLSGGTMTGNLNLGANTLTTSNTGLVSNLNADLLDGIDSSRLIYGSNTSGSNNASATQNTLELPQYKSGFWDTFGANWTPDTGWWWGLTTAHTSNSSNYNYSGQLAFANGGGGNNIHARTISNGNPSAWSKLWSNGNDGSGSGLDADLLDGQQGSYYMPAATDNWVNTNGDTMTGNLVLNADPSAALGAATKQYVDNLVNGLTWKAPVTDADGPTGGLGSYGTCDAGKQSWASYNKSDNIIYVCNGSAWVQMSSTVGLPNLAGDVTGSLTSNTIANNAVTSAKIADSTIVSGDILDGTIANADVSGTAAIAGTKISPNFGSQNVVTTGNVGVGTASPTQKLQLSGTNGIGFNDWSSDKKLYSPNDGTLEWMTHDGAGTHGFAVSHQGTQKVFLNTSGNSYLNGGNVGIGTASPEGKLEISSTMNAAPTTGAVVLSHPTNYQRSSVVFPSRINYSSDYGFIEYRDDDNDSGESAVLTVGTSNDADDDVLLDPTGRLRIDATNATLDSTGNLYTAGSANVTNYLQVNSKYAIDGTDSYLRLNQQNSFSNGIYTPYNLRVDGTFNMWGTGSLGDGGDDIAINSNDWDISSSGAMSGITSLAASGKITSGGYLNLTNDNLLHNGDFETNTTDGWSGITAIVPGGYAGNYTAQFTGATNLVSDDYIPVDPTKDVIQLEAYVKKAVAGSTPGILYFGYYAFDANKNVITSSPCGSYCYFATSGWTVPVDSAWHKISATTTGEGTSYPNFPVGTKYIRVLGLVNYAASADAVTQIDHISLKRINNGPLFVGNNFNSSNLVDQYQTSKLYTNNSNHFYVEPPANGHIILNTSGSGNVGIGTASPSEKLNVAGNVVATGGVMNSDIARISNPGGASYTAAPSSITGAWKIKLPAGSTAKYPMLQFTVNIYRYSTGQTSQIRVGGHFSGSSWYNVFAYGLTDNAPKYTARFGYDGSGSMVVWIGELNSTWEYPSVFVTDFQNGYSAIDSSWASGWSITNVTAFDTVSVTRDVAQAWNQTNDGSGSGLDADLLDGNQPSTSGGANTIVQRDGGGYISNSYFNSTDDVSSGTLTYLMGKFGDNYYRSATPAKVKTFLGLDAGGSGDIWVEKAGDTMTGNLNLDSAAIVNADSGSDSGMTGARHYQWGYQEGGAWTHPYPDLVLGYHTGMKLGANTGYGGVKFYNDHPSVSSTEIFSVGNGDNNVRVANNLYVGGNLAWHAGNDGSGSGLDADLLDGLNANSFFQYQGFTLDADTMAANRSGFTYSVNAPHTGPIALFDANGYGLQLNAPYYGGGENLSFRTRNGDNSTWNGWNTVWHTDNDGSGSGLDADLLDGISSTNLFNNMGQGHGSQSDFNAITDFGPRFVTGTTNGPGTGSSQFYSMNLGLGSNYPFSSYAMQVAIPRDVGADKYLSIRNREGGAWGSWSKISAGYADTAPASGLTGSTLASGVTASSLTSVGTLGSLSVSGAINGQTISSAANFTGTVAVASDITSPYHKVTAGNGYGVCFWTDCNNYKMHMGSAAEYYYGPVTEYAIKTNMGAGSSGRGWVWGTTGVTPVAAINVTGNMQIAGNFNSQGTGDNYFAGDVGIGTTSPTAALDVRGSVDFGQGKFNYNNSTGTTEISKLKVGAMKFADNAGTVSWIDLPVTNAAADNTVQSYSAQIDGNPILTVYGKSDGNGSIDNKGVYIDNGSFCVDNGGKNCDDSTRNAGTIYANTTSVGGMDVAETYPTKDMRLEAGDIVMLDPENPVFVKKYDVTIKDAVIIGIVSTKPGLLLGGFNEELYKNDKQVPVALAGRVPMKVSGVNGDIKIGDRITLSQVTGIGAKATGNGDNIVGIALENYTGKTAGEIVVFISLQKGVVTNATPSVTEATDRLCVGDTCVTETELQGLLKLASWFGGKN